MPPRCATSPSAVTSGRSWGVPGVRIMLRFAPICTPILRNMSSVLTRRIYRSKFNVPLGVEAQGFCVIR